MSRRFVLTIASVSMLLASTWNPAAASAQVNSADQICAPNADPCVITSKVSVASGAVLDFGLREVRIESGGRLDGGNGIWSLKCGEFVTSVGRVLAIQARGPNGFGQTDGGDFTLTAYRQCSAFSDARCVGDADCDFGTCSRRSCAGDSQHLCSINDDCQLGICVGSVCGGDSSRSCSSDADCSLGLCATEICSRPAEGSYLSCSADADCLGGQCSLGTGNVILDGKVSASGAQPGSISISGAGRVDVQRTLDISATIADSDGGFLDITAGAGTLTIDANIKASGGSLSAGGDVALTSGQAGVVINGVVDASGGDSGGGFVDVDALGDVTLSGSVDLGSANGSGDGGELIITAGGDLSLTGTASVKNSGHASIADGFGGGGGDQTYTSGGNFSAEIGVVLQSNGARPDGDGGGILIEAANVAIVAADVESRARGSEGGGGIFEIVAGGPVSIQGGSVIDVTGGDFGAGSVDVTAGADLVYAGDIRATAGGIGSADSVRFDVGRRATITGSVTMGGDPLVGNEGSGLFEVSACDINFATGATIDNSGPTSSNLLTGREQITIATGSSLLADVTTGSNTMIYRKASKVPVINGTVTPAAVLTLDPTLPDCPVCGNGAVETGESCDDGNTTAGDGCNDTCQDEACIAQTAAPGYPTVPLCDDGNACTSDSCGQPAGCSHVAVVDGTACNDDDVCNGPETCQGGACQAGVPPNCDDGKFCNGIEVCVASSGCRFGVPVDCSDGVSCTADVCNDAQAKCVSTPNVALCDDGNQCTFDSCDSGGGCLHSDSTASCDDGLACTVGDNCSAGVCSGTPSCPGGQVCDLVTGLCSTTTTTTLPTGVCGDGQISVGETCDDGDVVWNRGEYCGADCQVLICGDPDDNGASTASDALFTLRAAVGISSCDSCICDVNNAGGTTASDALRLLNFAIGIPGVSLSCATCP